MFFLPSLAGRCPSPLLCLPLASLPLSWPPWKGSLLSILEFAPELARGDRSLYATLFLLLAPWQPGEVFVFLFIVYPLAGSSQILLLD